MAGPSEDLRNVYVDSNVFLNVWFEEMAKFGQIFYSSKRLLEQVIECRFVLVISELTVRELAKRTGLPRETLMGEYLKPFEMVDKLRVVKVTRRVAEDAVQLSGAYGIHKTDALHAIMAMSADCVLVTRDDELIQAANRYGVRALRPEEII